MTRITSILHEDLFILVIVSIWILLRTRNISDKIFMGKKRKYFTFNHFFRNLCIFVIMWKNAVQPDGSQRIIYFGTCALHAGWVTLQSPAYNKSYLLLCTVEIETRTSVIFSNTYFASLVYLQNEIRMDMASQILRLRHVNMSSDCYNPHDNCHTICVCVVTKCVC